MQDISVSQNDKTAAGGIKRTMGKLAHSPFFLAFLLNLAAFIVCISCFTVRYEVSDDYMIDAVLSGAFGTGYDPYLLWGNPVLGHFLNLLYRLIPGISFYFVLLMILGFVSSTAVTYLLFKRKINAVTVCIALIFLCFFSDDLYVLVQFTKITAAAGIAGGLLILYGLWEEEKHKIRYIIFGTVLALTGSMVRFTTIYLYGIFLLITFLFYAISFFAKKKNAKESKKSSKSFSKEFLKTAGLRLLICVILVGSIFGVQYLGQFIRNSDSEYDLFNGFQTYRSDITDTLKPDYEAVEDEFNKLGLDYIDYCMLSSWQFVDMDVYSNETLGQVADLFKRNSDEQTHSLSYVFEVLTGRSILIYPAAYAIYLFVVIALLMGRRKIFPVVLLLSSVGLFVFFIFTGRTMYRVEWGVYFCAASCFMSTFLYDPDNSFENKTVKISARKTNFAAVGAMVIIIYVLLVRVLRILPDPVYKNMTDEEYRNNFFEVMDCSGEYLPEKTKLLASFRKPYAGLTDMMENDPDHFYYVDFPSAIQQLYYDYDPWIRPEEGLFRDHYAYFGSVVMHHPGEEYALSCNGADPRSPYKSLTNENIFLVDNWWPELKLAYVRKYYHQDAEIELMGTADGYQIWNIYVPESSE